MKHMRPAALLLLFFSVHAASRPQVQEAPSTAIWKASLSNWARPCRLPELTSNFRAWKGLQRHRCHPEPAKPSPLSLEVMPRAWWAARRQTLSWHPK